MTELENVCKTCDCKTFESCRNTSKSNKWGKKGQEKIYFGHLVYCPVWARELSNAADEVRRYSMTGRVSLAQLRAMRGENDEP